MQLYYNNTLSDTWTVYFAYPEASDIGANIMFGTLLQWGAGFGCIMGFLFVPAAGAWMYRHGRESTEIMAFMLFGCLLFGVLMYVFFLGGS